MLEGNGGSGRGRCLRQLVALLPVDRQNDSVAGVSGFVPRYADTVLFAECV